MAGEGSAPQLSGLIWILGDRVMAHGKGRLSMGATLLCEVLQVIWGSHYQHWFPCWTDQRL